MSDTSSMAVINATTENSAAVNSMEGNMNGGRHVLARESCRAGVHGVFEGQ